MGQNGSVRYNGTFDQMKNPLIVIVVLLSVIQMTSGQVSAYGSAAYGMSTNPLYNYQKISDRLLQTYVEVNSLSEMDNGLFRIQYVGGSMIFDRFALRNYYEHRISAGVSIGPKKTSAGSPSDSVDEEEEIPDKDSSGVFLLSDLSLTARHDRKEYQEFNNQGVIANNGIYFCREHAYTVRALSKTEYRYYPHLLSYNNLSEIVSLQVDNGTISDQQYGMYVSGGVKYFTNMVYDTSLFEENRSYTVSFLPDSQLVGTGKDKHWVYFTYADTGASDKFVIKDPKTNSTYQVALGMFFQTDWDDVNVRMECRYRFNSKSTLLTVVQNTSALTLNEDLYNSVFNAHGPEFQCVIQSHFLYNVQWLMNIECEQKIFETPSYDVLSGEIAHQNRKDTRINVELYVSRFMQITDGLGADVAFSSTVLRNRSNDAYNDYSLMSYSLSIGISL